MQLRKKLMWLGVSLVLTIVLATKWYIHTNSRLDTNISGPRLIGDMKTNEPHLTHSKEQSTLKSGNRDRTSSMMKRLKNAPSTVSPKELHNSVAATPIRYSRDVKRKANKSNKKTKLNRDVNNGNHKSTSHSYTSTDAVVTAKKTYEHRLNKLVSILSKAACENNIILTIVDRAYLPMFWNLWKSLHNVKLTQCFLPISLDIFTFEALTNKNITTYFEVGYDSKSNVNISKFGTVEFNRKTNQKITYLLQVLKLGYNVLFTDGDVVFLRDPFETLNCVYPDCDLAVQSNGMRLPWQLLKESGLHRNTKTDEINSGFMYLRASKPTISLFTKVRSLSIKGNFSRNDQDYLNIVAQPILCKTTKSDLKIKILDKQKYVPGLVLKQMQKVAPEVVIIHNNFLMEHTDKIAGFKKFGLWYDHNK
ncbi:unnamed protein product [Owenia fusiformis]|uniref:Uncharacterized protein n=1 Tax=Owenia fusiformis TaxID=6347 RepID=A0A8J1T5K0_OWEFU|nr:unnamed protein product [Owenia fusiformis]